MKNLMPFACLLAVAVAGCSDADDAAPAGAQAGTSASEMAEVMQGPHGGRMLTDGDFTLELAIFEDGKPPEFRAWASQAGKVVSPSGVQLAVQLTRLGGAVDRIGFAPRGDYLRGDHEIYEPHSFQAKVTASHAGKTHEWAYESFEGRISMPADVAASSGVATAAAGPGVLRETLTLYGMLQPNAERVRSVSARFPGIIRSVSRQIGDPVKSGQVLATIESNESLQVYSVTAPIAGMVTQRRANPGETTGAEPLFVISDYRSLWAELGVFPRDRGRLTTGQRARIRAADGAQSGSGEIGYISPAGDADNPRLVARVEVDNARNAWTPGQFVTGEVAVGETPVPLVVPLPALQKFRDWDVVFLQAGESYEARPLQLGRRDGESVEVLGGLNAGDRIVVANSYLIKADIEKSGASHDH